MFLTAFSNPSVYIALAIGIAFLAFGVEMAMKPSIVEWIAERSNRRTAEWFDKRGFSYLLRDYPHNVRRMKVMLPLLFMVIGAVWVMIALAEIRRL